MMTEHFLDVSQLEPPEPMEQILALIPTLREGDYIKVYHRREPVPLFTILETMGYTWHTDKLDDDRYHIYIWRKDDSTAERQLPIAATR